MDERTSKGRGWILIAGAVLGILSLLAAVRPVTPQEAFALLESPSFMLAEKPSTLEGTIQAGWSHFAGAMWRPARWLSVLLAAATLVVSMGLIQKHPARAVVMVAAAGFWSMGSSVGGLHISSLITALSLLAIQRLFGMPREGLLIAAGLIAGAAPHLAARLAPDVVPQDAGYAERVADLLRALSPAGGPEAAVALGGLFLVALLVIGCRSSRDVVYPLAGLGLAISLAALPELGGIVPISGEAGATALLPLLALIVGGPARWNDRTVLTALLLIAVPATGLAMKSALTTGDRRDIAAAVSSLQIDRVDDADAWVFFCGDDRRIALYYERSGHRTGHRVRLVPDDIEASEAARTAHLARIPLVLTFDAGPELTAALAPFYQRATPEDGQDFDGIAVFKYRTGR